MSTLLVVPGQPGSGVDCRSSAVTTFGFGTATHSLLRSPADRLPANGSSAGRVRAGLVVDGVVALAGLVANRALAPRPGEASARSLGRLAASTSAATAVARVGAHLVKSGVHRRGGRLITAAVTVVTSAASYA